MRLILLLILCSLLAINLSAQACTDAESGVLTVNPPLPAGGANYPAGTVLDICFTLNEFDTPQANWLHAIIPEHGPGFDLSTLIPISSPSSCNGNGNWGWYNMWTSCALNLNYGPGFSYDGTAGLGCGGTGNDGDPGNNWGDGPGFCSRTWCWQITTGPAPTGCNAESYLTQIYIYGDGEAGSWSNAPCLNDAPLCWPQITDVQAMVNNPCPGNDFTLTGSFDAEAGCGIQVEWTGPNGFTSSDINTTAPDEGVYTLSINIAGCTTYDVSVTAMWNATTPGVTPGPSTTFCYGETVTMTGTGGDSYLFTAPDGTTYSTNPVVFTADETTEGTWSVTVYNAPDCEDIVFSEIIVLPELTPMATAVPDPVCEGEDVTLTGSGAGPGGTYVWGGGVPAFTGNPYIYTPPGPGNYTATLTITNSGGCSEMVDVTFTVNPNPFVTITANPMASCEGDPVVLTATGGGTYMWNNGMSGSPITVNPTTTTTYTVTVTNSFGCTAEESITIDVQPLLDAPMLECSSSNPSNITWTWPPVPGADFYHIYIDGVLVETNWTSNSYTVTGLDPITTVNIRVIPFSNNNTNCPGQDATLTCTSPDCNPVSFFLESPMTFCYDPTVFDPIQLIIGVSGMDASQGSVQWSGPGVLFPGGNPGQFVPPSAGTYTLTATFTLDNGSCEYSESFTFTVVESANADINASDLQICSDETVTVSLGGAYNSSATYDWDFGSATVISGTNEGPYELSFPSAGSYDISLMTSLGDCDDMDEITITVDDPLTPPTVFCQYTTQDTVIFAWSNVAGASGYNVNVISGPSGTRFGNTYVVSGLSFGDQVEISVTAISSGNCPDVTSLSQICEAQSCPDAQLSIDNAPQTFCNDGNNAPIILTLTLTDAVAPTDTVWSGPGVVNNTFDADIAGPGIHAVSVTVTDENCPFTTSVNMTVLDLPTADFMVTTPVCIDTASFISYTGSANPATSTFFWDFDGGTVVSGSGGGPYEVSWPTSGTYTVLLAVNDGNCASTQVQHTVDVVDPLSAPVVNCVDPALDGFTFEWNTIPGATGYEVTLISGQAGVQMGNTYVVSGLSEGDEVTIQVVALGNGPCGNSAPVLATCEARSCEMIELIIGQPASDFCQDGNNDLVVMTATTIGGVGDGVFSWSGPGMSNDTFYVANANLGDNELVATYVEAGCTYQDTVIFTLYALPDPGFTVTTSPACTDQAISVTYEVAMPLIGSHVWTFDGGAPETATGPGPHLISWPVAGTYTITHEFTVNGCSNTASQDVEIINPLPVPVLTCGQNDLNSTTFNWSAIAGNLGYAVSINGGQEDTVTATTYTVSGLTPDSIVTISVRVLGSDPCGDGNAATLSCPAASCPDLVADFSLNTTAICLDTSLDQSTILQATVTGGIGNGTYTYSGPGVTDYVFDPASAGVGVHTITMTYEESGPCILVDDFTIEVFALPIADFSLSATEICTENLTVTFTGSAPAGTMYNWDFDGATVVSGTGAGPYELNWPSAGTYTISLSLESPGDCAATAIPQDVEVSAPLAAPVIQCGDSTLNTTTFEWTAIPGALGYIVQSGGMTDTITATSYTVTGLSPGESATISVTPLGQAPCGNGPTISLSCSAASCPDLIADFSLNITAICLDTAFDQSITLQATVTGGLGSGTYTYSGPGVTDDTFDPASAGVGVHTITMTYEESGPCILVDDFTIEVFALPIADFSISATEICTENLTVTFTGSAPAGTMYNWDFDGATVISGTGAGSYELNWPSAGTYTISLSLESPGDCAAVAIPQDVEVSAPLAAPVIQCGDSTLTTTTFEWMAIPGALGYIVQSGGMTDTITSTSYTVTGLSPGETATISVTPLGQAPCGNGPTVSITCSAALCPTITLNPSAPATDFCLDGMTGAVVLSATSSGGDMTGTFTWSGPGVSLVGTDFTFDPVLAGLGAHTLTVDYVETAGCSGTNTLVMNVYEVPTAAFNTSSLIICEDEVTTITYAGTAGGTATYTWDFDGATVNPLSNETYDLSWPSAGSYTVGLTVSENGCSSTASVEITVVAPLATPDPGCGVTGLTEVTFEWLAVVGATGYSVSINGQTPFIVNGTSHTESGLGESEVVTMTIFAIGSPPCGDSEAVTVSCQSDACPTVSLLPSAAQTAFCTDAGDPPVLLELTTNGGNGTGNTSWNGPGIVQNGTDFFFDPSLLAPGSYTLTATYDESICSFSEDMVMQVNATPVAQFSSSTNALCSVSSMIVSFNGTAGNGASYDWNFDGANVISQGGESYSLQWSSAGNYTVSLTVSQAGCSTSTSAMMTVAEPPVAGQQFQPRVVCAGSGEIIELSSLVSGADAGGVWSPGVGAPAVVDAGTGQLNTFNLAPGTYEYLYTVAGGVCDDAVAGVMITIQPSPVASAGIDQVLTCDMGMVSLNGTASTGGSELIYAWTGPDGNPVPVDADNSMIDVSQPGMYTLTVTSDIGCTATDQVEVRADTEVPIPQVELNNISCFSSEDGAILVADVEGGRPPYNYSLNGSAPGGTTFFTGLDQGEYSLRVSDANGCFSEIFLGVSQPDLLEVSVNLVDGTNDYDEGDQVTLSAQISGGNVIDTIVWQPDSLNRVGEGTSNTITFIADQTRTISVTVTDENGCRASDRTTILVRRDRPIYIPSGYSPNGDNVNDILFIGANNDQVVNIQKFLVFNRWGESVFENYDFQPNDPAQGWDGTHRGELLNPAVFVYVAVVEFTDGEVVTFKGDVTLIR